MMNQLLLTVSLAASAYATNTSWPGWPSISHLFIFGDSYTQTGFDPTSTQPSPSNPFGNPPYPGWTSSNGPNWAGFLTTTYNASTIFTYNLASGGATVDSALVAPYAPTVKSVKEQVETQFLPIYAYDPATSLPSVKWTSANALFAFWIGINDVGNAWWRDNATAIYDAIFVEYADLLDKMHGAGARNFVFLSVPPVNLSPLILNQADDGYASEYEGRVIADWNARLGDVVEAFKGRKEGVTAFVHDTHALFMRVIEDPGRVEQTAGLKNVTGFCEAYKSGTPTWYTKDPSCEFAVNEYLWLNELHPTFPAHNATAASVAELLSG